MSFGSFSMIESMSIGESSEWPHLSIDAYKPFENEIFLLGILCLYRTKRIDTKYCCCIDGIDAALPVRRSPKTTSGLLYLSNCDLVK
jgi:hypothetical protein